jgi:hypothetical protein
MESGPSHEGAPTTVFLHIGCPKSGTSHIQARLSENVELARTHGIYWPMPWGCQVEGVRNLGAVKPPHGLDPDGAWTQLAHAILAEGSRAAVVSMEWLVGLRPPQIEACVLALAPARVEVICTARDLLRTLPAHWQESVQNYRTWSWEEFVKAVIGKPDGHPAHRQFWRQHDVPKILGRWSSVVPWDRIHLVTVPQPDSDRELLWRRFCSVVAVPPEDYAWPRRSNPSLSVHAARLMELINRQAHDRGVPNRTYMRYYKRLLSKQILANLATDPTGIAVSRRTSSWLRRRARELVKEIEQLPVRVVGDPAELLPGDRLEGRVPSTVSDPELLPSAIATIIDLMELQAKDASA